MVAGRSLVSMIVASLLGEKVLQRHGGCGLVEPVQFGDVDGGRAERQPVQGFDDRQRLGDGQYLPVDVAGEAVDLQDLPGGLVDQAAAVDGGDHSVFTEQPPDQRDQGFGEGLPRGPVVLAAGRAGLGDGLDTVVVMTLLGGRGWVSMRGGAGRRWPRRAG